MARNITLMIISTLIIFNLGCKSKNENAGFYSILKAENFQKQIDGKQTNLYFLKNGDVHLAITNYGARIVGLCLPDKNGDYSDVVLGFKSIDEYLNANEVFHGAIIGRVANRIADGKFTLDGKEFTLPINNKTNQLHGGEKGFHNQVWEVESFNESTIVLSYFSKEGEMGYPGNLTVEVRYLLNSDNSLKIIYKATTDKNTPVMLTNHAFWNLSGEGEGSINDHILTIKANHWIVIDSTLIPTGELASVEGTVFDFRKPKAVGKDLIYQLENEQLKNGLGYDNNWIVVKDKFGEMSFAGSVLDPKSGRKMEVYTEEPILLFYGGNFLNGTDTGKYGKTFEYREAFCLETHHYPDSPNHPDFPSIILTPDNEYASSTIYKFSFN